MNRAIDLATLFTGIVVFGTGLVLLGGFHVGEDAVRASGLGLSRLAWVNLHRLLSLALTAGVAVHAWRHRRGVIARLRRPRKARPSDMILYFGFVVVPLAGLAAWFLVPGSPPLHGPIAWEPLSHGRNLCLDLHHLSGLILLPAAVLHVRRHLRGLL